jgi:hypothetical protein
MELEVAFYKALTRVKPQLWKTLGAKVLGVRF